MTHVRWTHDSAYLVSTGGGDTATVIWKHDGPFDIESVPGKTTVKSVSAAPNGTSVPIVRPEHGESDDSDNTDSEEEGYDSDVQHDRDMDYNTRILINPDRLKTEKKDEIRRRAATANRKPM